MVIFGIRTRFSFYVFTIATLETIMTFALLFTVEKTKLFLFKVNLISIQKRKNYFLGLDAIAK